MSEKNEEAAEAGWIKKFFTLFFVGFFIILLGVIILVVGALLYGGSNINIGGFILIGPIPIVFGAGPEAPWLVVFAIILGVLSIILFLVFWKRGRETSA